VADAAKMLSVPFDGHAPVLVAQYRPTSGTRPSVRFREPPPLPGPTAKVAKRSSIRDSQKEIYGTGESAGAVQPKPKSEDLGEWWLSVVRPTEAVDHLAGPLANDRRLRPSRRRNSAILPVQPNPSWADNHEELGFPTEDRRVSWIRRIAHRLAVQMDPIDNYEISFGPFRLLPLRRLLLEGEKPVRIGARARDILVALIEKPGQVLSKEELIARAWPNTFVDEGNLKVHVGALRRALGNGISGNQFVTTVHGRGYCFIAPLSVSRTDSRSPLAVGDVDRLTKVPAPLQRMVGRSEAVAEIITNLVERRFITIAGGGGFGKTTVALAVADLLRDKYRDGVQFIDLAPVTDPALVAGALAVALALGLHTENPLPGLTQFLREKRTLLVLDSCEHVVAAAAVLAETLFIGAPDVHILATSREPLGAEGERVYRLAPLGLPPRSNALTSAEALQFSAIKLFVERAASRLDHFKLSDADAPIVADICRHLDGIPLAIEIVAGRLDAFGVRGAAALLDGRLKFLTHGRRTVAPRHQTLNTTLDWSYELLPEAERLTLRRLAIFTGGFAEAGAVAIAAGETITSWDVAGIVANLFAKSLVSVDVSQIPPIYRLLEATRSYAFEKLFQSGELDGIARRHAKYYQDLFERAEVEWASRSTDVWLENYGRDIDGLRAALDWAFSPGGDEAIGVGLVVAAAPLWMHLSLADECRRRSAEALACLRTEASRSGRSGMKLYSALGLSLLFTKGAAPETHAALTRALAIAEARADTDAQLRALWGLWADRQNNGAFNEGFVLARRFKDLAASSVDSVDLQIGDRMIGSSLHFLGDQAGARLHIERMLANYAIPTQRSHTVRFQFDQKVTANITLARVLWLQGYPDQAMRAVNRNIDYALSINHTLSLCNALAQAACPVALAVGDLAAAEHLVELLIHYTAGNRLDVWHAYGRACRGVLTLKQGDLRSGVPILRAAIDDLRNAHFVQFQTAFLANLAEGLVRAGEVDAAFAAIEEALAQAERTGERWSLPELFRVKGETILRAQKPDAETEAEAQFIASINLARHQQAPAWELRTAISLAQSQRDRGRKQEARELLRPIFNQFTEGFGTTDLKIANQLLNELS
jgi:predicted ATPase/DNA-binding winged helix-turn-helix (wHTH) protein